MRDWLLNSSYQTLADLDIAIAELRESRGRDAGYVAKLGFAETLQTGDVL